MNKVVYTEERSKLVVAYIRVDRWGESAATQHHLIATYAAQQGYTILKWYQDEDHPGYNRLDWDEATDAVRRGPAYRLLYTSLDRLGDRAVDLIELTGQAEAGGWLLEGVDGTTSSDLPWKRAAYQVEAARAELAVNLREQGRHSLRFSTEEMREVYLLLRLASDVGDQETADRYAKRFKLGGTE